MSGMYEASIKVYRRKSTEALYKINQSFQLLKNKTSDYAKEHLALAELHQSVWEIWHKAPNHIKEAGDDTLEEPRGRNVKSAIEREA